MSNEITVKLQCSTDDVCKILENEEFKIVEKYLLDDTYFVSTDLDIENIDIREIISRAVLLRDITGYQPLYRVVKQTFKNKKFDQDGNIISQSKVDCEIVDANKGRKFFEAIGYRELMRIVENDIEYEKDGLRIAVKDIKNGLNLIELEENEEYENDNGQSVPYLPKGYAVLLAPACGTTSYGAVTQLEDDDEWHTYAESRVPLILTDKKGQSKELRLASAPLLMPNRHQAWMTAHVITVND